MGQDCAQEWVESPTGMEAMSHQVTIATDQNHDYAFFAPLTAVAWRTVVGYMPLVILVGAKEDWSSQSAKLVVRSLQDLDILHTFLSPTPGYRTSTVAQVSRLYGWLFAANSDYVIASDMDMWPTSREWFRSNEAEAGSLSVLYANNQTRFPICYSGAAAATWARIMGVDARNGVGAIALKDVVDDHMQKHLSVDSGSEHAWQHDEEWLTERILAWPGYGSSAHLVQRASGEPPADRLDRSAWTTLAPGHVDAHLLRPGFLHWDNLRRLFRTLVPGMAQWAEQYVEEYKLSL